MKRFLNGLLVLVVLVGGIGIGAVLGDRLVPPFLGSTRSGTSSQVVASLTKEQQVVLLSLGVQGIESEQVKGTVLGLEIPGSDRVQFVQYSYLAKLGVDGGRVKVERTGDQAYRITVPPFLFIGHDKEQFKVAVEKDGLLSWMTPQVDSTKLITKVLSDRAMTEQVETNRSTLEDQARVFYEGIVHGIEPQARVELVFQR